LTEQRAKSRAGQGRAGQGRAGQGRAGQGRAGQIYFYHGSVIRLVEDYDKHTSFLPFRVYFKGKKVL
jgi:hypothetical protein